MDVRPNLGNKTAFYLVKGELQLDDQFSFIFNAMKGERVMNCIPAQLAFTLIVCSSIWNLVAAREVGIFVSLTIQVGVVVSIDSITNNLSSIFT